MVVKSQLHAIARRCEGIQMYDYSIYGFNMIPLKIINFNHIQIRIFIIQKFMAISPKIFRLYL